MSPSHDVLERLGQQLLACAAPSLLDAPLDVLAEDCEDEVVRDVLIGIFEAGEADSLRQLCTDGTLATWADRTATPREEQALRVRLRQWLGEGLAGPDDPARLATVPPLPDDLEGMLAWARPYELLGELSRPAVEVLHEASELAPDASLVECALGSARPGPRAKSLLAGERARESARAHLVREAARHAALGAREALWKSRSESPPLRRLEERLRAVLAGRSLEILHAVGFVPAHPTSLEASTGTARTRFRAGEGESPVRTKLFLSGHEHRAIEGECDRCERHPCVHVAALAARLLDACLLPTDRLHGPLVQLVGEPSWKRFLDSLDPEAPGEEARTERVAFRLRIEGERAFVQAVLEKRRSDGRFTGGNAIPPAKLLRSPACTERDRLVLEAMSHASRTLGGTNAPADLALLRTLADHPRVELEDPRAPVRLVEEVLELAMLERPEGLLPRISLGGAPVPPGVRPSSLGELVRFDAARSALVFAPLGRPMRLMLAALVDFRGVLPPESHPRLAPFLSSVSVIARLNVPEALRGHELPAARRLLLRITPSFDEGIDVALTMRAIPMGPLFPPGRGPEREQGFVEGRPVHARRDLAWESQTAASIVEALGLERRLRLEENVFRIESEQEALEVLSAASRLDSVLEIEWAENAARPHVLATARAEQLHIGISTKGKWFELRGGVETPVADVAIAKLLDAARRGDRFVAIRGRDYIEIERELFERLRAAQLCVSESLRQPTIPMAAAPFWLEKLGDRTGAVDDDAARWLDGLRTASPISPEALPIPTRLASQLRDYQREGVAFLLERSQWAPGVCLADEMGLGKTVQAIALLAARGSMGPALVVAPTSVVGNWVIELERFAPELAVLEHRGETRHGKLAGARTGTVVVTSYDLLLRDRADFDGLSFATLIVDEAQMVKNAGTLRAKAVSSLDAGFRVALSGTPVENRLGDLWSLFHLVAPGLLGPWPRFRARFGVPIERYQKEERAAALRALVAPFLLRRTKDRVATELPSRTEVIHRIELSRAEKALYDAAVREARRSLGRRRDDSTRTVRILAELTRLRQLACHPRLVVDDETLESSKLHALMQLLEDLLPRGHRILVFSQFTRHLGLVREALIAAGIAHLELDGSTPATQRSRLVADFQAGTAPVFLISLKAGGTGLNLTAADYVVHLDPWWNPAAEDQASDRAHRIGQERPLTIVKLVSAGTIEEAVLTMHGDKRRLAEAVVGTGEAVSAPDVEALEALLELR